MNPAKRPKTEKPEAAASAPKSEAARVSRIINRGELARARAEYKAAVHAEFRAKVRAKAEADLGPGAADVRPLRPLGRGDSIRRRDPVFVATYERRIDHILENIATVARAPSLAHEHECPPALVLVAALKDQPRPALFDPRALLLAARLVPDSATVQIIEQALYTLHARYINTLLDSIGTPSSAWDVFSNLCASLANAESSYAGLVFAHPRFSHYVTAVAHFRGVNFANYLLIYAGAGAVERALHFTQVALTLRARPFDFHTFLKADHVATLTTRYPSAVHAAVAHSSRAVFNALARHPALADIVDADAVRAALASTRARIRAAAVPVAQSLRVPHRAAATALLPPRTFSERADARAREAELDRLVAEADAKALARAQAASRPDQ